MRLRYTPQARADLLGIRSYIRNVLMNPSAAENTVERITRQVNRLRELPYMGGELSAKTGMETDYRYLVTGKHIVFYKVTPQEGVIVERVLDGRTQYLSILFDDIAE